MIDLTALRKACDLATPGPWFVQADGSVLGIFGPKMAAYNDEPEQEWREVQIVETDGGHYPPRWNDAAFIAAARSAVPALLDEVTALRAEHDRLRSLVDRWEALGKRHDIGLREAECVCTWEQGDSKCPAHPTCDECGCVVCECAIDAATEGKS